MKKFLFVFLALVAFLPGAIVYASSYTGPGNRTIEGGTTCDIVLRYCTQNHNGWRWVADRSWSCGNQSQPWLAWPKLSGACNASREGAYGWEEERRPGQPITYDPVLTSHSLTCGTPGNPGWCLDNLMLTLNASEPIPGYSIMRFDNDDGVVCNPANAPSVTCTIPLTGQGMHTGEFWALSTFGDTSIKRAYSWSLDSLAPALAATASGSQTGNWYTSNVTLSLSGADVTSGIAPSTYRHRVNGGAWQSGNSLTIAADGVYTINAEVQDVAGNTGVNNITIRLDKTPPTLNPSVSGTQQNGWFRTVVIAASNAADATSGLASVQHRVNGGTWQNGASITISADGIHTVVFHATDNAGHVTTHEVTFSVDRSPPGVSPTVAPNGHNGWYVSNPLIPLSANDSLSGILSGSLRYRVNGQAWQTGSNVAITEDGTHSIEAQVNDLAGNTGAVAFDVHVDTTPPDLAIAVSSAASVQNGWHAEPATVGAIASDATSGLAVIEYRVETAVASVAWAGPFSLVPQSAWVISDNLMLTDGDHLVFMRATDVAGNQTVTSERVRVDLTTPLSTFALVDGPVTGVVLMAGASFDALSGVDVVEYSFDDGLTWETIAHTDGAWAIPFDTTSGPDGDYTLLVRATDVAGHTETSPASLTITVNNAPPKVSMTESWWIWESGQLAVQPGLTPMGDIRLQIACGSLPDVILDFKNLDKFPSEFTWNRRCGDGHLAAPGEYPVTLTACNIYGKCGTALGTIRIPEGQTQEEPETELTGEPEPTPTSAPPSPTGIPLPEPPAEIVMVIAEAVPEVVARLSLWLLPLAGIVGSLAALGLNHLRDPRPTAIRKLGSLLGRRVDE